MLIHFCLILAKADNLSNYVNNIIYTCILLNYIIIDNETIWWGVYKFNWGIRGKELSSTLQMAAAGEEDIGALCSLCAFLQKARVAEEVEEGGTSKQATRWRKTEWSVSALCRWVNDLAEKRDRSGNSHPVRFRRARSTKTTAAAFVLSLIRPHAIYAWTVPLHRRWDAKKDEWEKAQRHWTLAGNSQITSPDGSVKISTFAEGSVDIVRRK